MPRITVPPFRLFSIFLFLTALCAAQPLPERAPLAGIVTTTAGKPIGGALVTVRREYGFATTATFWGGQLRTGADGKFHWPEAEEGDYGLLIEASGFAGISTPLKWTAGAPAYLVKMVKLTGVSADITDASGAPLKTGTAFFHLRSEAGRLLYPQLPQGAGGTTVVGEVAPGRYWLHVIVPGQGFAIAPNIEILENKPVRLKLSLQPGGGVRATAKTPDGRAVGGAALILSQNVASPASDGMHYLRSQPVLTADGSGELLLRDIAPGEYVARLYAFGQPLTAGQNITVKAGETVSLDGTINLKPNAQPLEITVQSSGGEPLADREFVVRLYPMSGGQPVPLVEGGPPLPPEVPPGVMSLFVGVMQRRARTNAQGKMSLFPVPAGSWRVMLTDPQASKETAVRTNYAEVKVGDGGGSVTMKWKQP